MEELVLSHNELTDIGRRVLAKGEPVSIFFLNAAALMRVGLHKPTKVSIELENGERKSLVMDRVH